MILIFVFNLLSEENAVISLDAVIEPVTASTEPEKVKFASSTIADVPLPVKTRLFVNEVAPVPPLATGTVPPVIA
jgi:hypothetical protein